MHNGTNDIPPLRAPERKRRLSLRGVLGMLAPAVVFMAGATCILRGVVALAGHAMGIHTTGAWGATRLLHPLGAVLFILTGCSLYASMRPSVPRRLLRGLGVALLALSGTAFTAQLLGWTLPFTPSPDALDSASRPETGSHPAVLTFAFACIAGAIILRHARNPRLRSGMFLPLLPVLWTVYLSLTASFYGVVSLNEYFAHMLLPVPTALLLGAVIVGLTATQPRRGFMGAFNLKYLGGILACIAFPVMILSHFTVGWARIRALRSGDYDIAAAFSQFATTNLLIFGALLWFCAHMLNRIDARRVKTMRSLQRANDELMHVNNELQRLNVALATKIEEQARTEEARKRTELQLFQSQKMEAMGTLAAGIAHDFNNLLTVMLLNTDDALEASPAGSPMKPPLEEIRKSGLRAAEVVRQIMTFARKSPGERRPVSLGELAAEAAELLRRGLPRNVTLTLSSLEALPYIEADPTQVQQVLLNLGTNAAQSMSGCGGMLTLSGECVSFLPPDPLPHPDLRYREYVCLHVRDDGCGIDDGVLKRIFDPFFTTKPPGKGTGLGLSIVHGIMQLHEGCVTVQSRPGLGTTFHLYFPVAPALGAPAHRNAA